MQIDLKIVYDSTRKGYSLYSWYRILTIGWIMVDIKGKQAFVYTQEMF